MAQQEPPRKMRKIDNDDAFLVKTGTFDVQSNWLKIFEAQEAETGHFDVTFEIEDRKLYAHKFMLACNSETFQTRFSKPWTTNEAPIKIKSYSYNDFKTFISMMYSGEYTLSNKNVKVMIEMAEFYGIQSLKVECDEFLMSQGYNIQEAIDMVDFAKKYALKGCLKHLNVVINCLIENLLKKKHATKEDIIALIKLNTSDTIFKAVFYWAKSRCVRELLLPEVDEIREAMKVELCDIIPHLKVTDFSNSFSQMLIEKHRFLFTEDQLNLMEQACHLPLITVSDTNCPCYLLKGRIHADAGMMEKLQASDFSKVYGYKEHGGFHWNGKVKIVARMSELTIHGKAPYYLVICRKTKHFAIKQRKDLSHDYLLAEMFGKWHPSLKENCKITLV